MDHEIEEWFFSLIKKKDKNTMSRKATINKNVDVGRIYESRGISVRKGKKAKVTGIISYPGELSDQSRVIIEDVKTGRTTRPMLSGFAYHYSPTKDITTTDKPSTTTKLRSLLKEMIALTGKLAQENTQTQGH